VTRHELLLRAQSLLRNQHGALSEELSRTHAGFGLGQVPKKLKPDATTTLVCGSILLLIFLTIVFAPFIAPHDPIQGSIARRLNRDIEDLVVIVLDRPRHKTLISQIREAGARIRLISDGDLSAGISAAVAGSGVHAVMGTGGAPEGVLTAAAMKCLNGQILARFVLKEQLEDIEDRNRIPEGVVDRMKEMGISDPRRIYDTDDLAPGKKIIFAATGVTDGTILQGVRFFGTGTRTSSIIMATERTKRVRFVDTVYIEGGPDTVVRF